MNINKTFQSIIAALFSCNFAFSQMPLKEWDQAFGGIGGDALQAMQPTSDGGFITAGYSSSVISGDKTQACRGGQDYWVVKIDANGLKQWDVVYGGNDNDYLFAVLQTLDGGYLLGGKSASDISGDKTQASQGYFDYWIVKTDANGIKQWDARFGGSQQDELNSMQQTTDGGYVLGGFSDSGISGDKTQASQGLSDYWMVKTDVNGIKEWDARFGGNLNEELHSLQQTEDGGYVLGGKSESGISGDRTQSSWGGTDYWILKTDANGIKIWDARFGGNNSEALKSISQTTDGGYLLCGHSFSGKSGDKTQFGKGSADYWIVKTDVNGTKQWDASFGGTNTDYLLASVKTADGYLIGGDSNSGVGGDKTQPNWGTIATTDYWIVKTDSNGIFQWDARFGGTNSDFLLSMQNTVDAGYILGGYSRSGYNGDKTQNSQGNFDFWLVKLEGSPASFLYYADADSDSYGNALEDSLSNYQPAGYVSNLQDCNDANASVHPLAPEICNGIDDNCNSLSDDADLSTIGKINYYADGDSDEYGNAENVVQSCIPVAGYVLNNSDCDDTNPNSHPGAADICNSVDDNCNGSIDEEEITAVIFPEEAVSICSGSTITLTALNASDFSCQWLKNGTAISGATNSSFTTGKAGNYQVNVTGDFNCNDLSAITAVAVLSKPTATITPLGSNDICLTGFVILQANNGEGFIYQWLKGKNNIAGATDQTFTAGSKGTYKVTVTNSNGCSKTSTGLKVTQSCRENEAAGFTSTILLYPNPATGLFTLEVFTGEDEELFHDFATATVEIINAYGRVVYKESITLEKGTTRLEIVPADSWTKGIYFVKVTLANKDTISKSAIGTGKIFYQPFSSQ